MRLSIAWAAMAWSLCARAALRPGDRRAPTSARTTPAASTASNRRRSSRPALLACHRSDGEALSAGRLATRKGTCAAAPSRRNERLSDTLVGARCERRTAGGISIALRVPGVSQSSIGLASRDTGANCRRTPNRTTLPASLFEDHECVAMNTVLITQVSRHCVLCGLVIVIHPCLPIITRVRRGVDGSRSACRRLRARRRGRQGRALPQWIPGMSK
jgi:hypothetical protein